MFPFAAVDAVSLAAPGAFVLVTTDALKISGANSRRLRRQVCHS